MSVILCKPTLLGPILAAAEVILDELPLLFERCCASDVAATEFSLVVFGGPPQVDGSRSRGDAATVGLLCTLKLGDTARRLMEYTSKSSSLERFPNFFAGTVLAIDGPWSAPLS